MREHYHDSIAFYARMTPAARALVDDVSGRIIDYATMERRVGSVAAGLRDLGVASGDRVATLMLNSSDTFEILFACPRLRAIFLPLNWRLAIPELEEIARQSTPRVLVYSPEFEKQAMALRSFAPDLILIRSAFGAPGEYESLATGPDHVGPPAALDWNETWTIIYTSGTTGRPKGALITYKMVFFNNVHTTWLGRLSARAVCATFLPTFHIGGLHAFPNPTIFNGGSLIVMPKYDAARLLTLLTDPTHNANRNWGVPTTFQFMSELPEFAAATFNPDCLLGTGGAPTPISQLELYQSKNVTMLQGWGMTETTTTGAILTEDRLIDKIGSVGKPIMDVETRLVTRDGRDAGPDEVGEMWIKGPTVTPGYWANPEANALAFEDGWFKTGDAFRRDADGYLYMVDRWKDMYISGGENVYPAEVENEICSLPEVSQAAVIGIPDPRWGETGAAFILLKSGATLTEDAVLARCNARLARYKIPKRVIFVKELPLTPSGKVVKAALREIYARTAAGN